MKRASILLHLRAIEDHISSFERQIINRRDFILSLKCAGCDTTKEVALLGEMEEQQTEFVAERDRLHANLAVLDAVDAAQARRPGVMERPDKRRERRHKSPWTAYDFATDEMRVASSRLGRALSARAFKSEAVRGQCAEACTQARRVFDKMIDLYPRARLDTSQRATFLKELALLRSRLEECED